MPIFPAYGRLKQKDCHEFGTSLDYRMRPKQAWCYAPEKVEAGGLSNQRYHLHRESSCQSSYKGLGLKTTHTPKIIHTLYIYETNLKRFKCVYDLYKSCGVQQFRDVEQFPGFQSRFLHPLETQS